MSNPNPSAKRNPNANYKSNSKVNINSNRYNIKHFTTLYDATLNVFLEFGKDRTIRN